MSFGKNHTNSNQNTNQQFSQNNTGHDNYTGTTDFSQTSTPTNPSWVSTTAAGLNGGIDRLTGVDPRSFVAGPTSLQTTAAGGAADISNTPWNYDAAADLTRGAANTSWLDHLINGTTPQATAAQTGAAPTMDAAQTGAAPWMSGAKAKNYMDDYANPYQQQVVDATMADFDHNAGLTRAQQDLDLTGSGAFGGSGAALTKSATEGELARARASTDAGIRSHGFETALGAGQSDADRANAARALNTQEAGQFAQAQAEREQAARAANQGYGAQFAQANADRSQAVNVLNPQLTLQDIAQKAGIGMAGQQQQLSSGQQLANLSGAYGDQQRATAATQAGIGGQLQQIQQQFAQAPIEVQQYLTQMFAGLPLNLFHGGTEAGTQTEAGTEDQTGTSSGTQTGTSNGSSTGYTFGFGHR